MLLTLAYLGFWAFSFVYNKTHELNLWLLSSAGYTDTDRFLLQLSPVAVIAVQCSDRQSIITLISEGKTLFYSVPLCLYTLSVYVLYMYVNRQIENEQIL